jgi:hypothetical protein
VITIELPEPPEQELTLLPARRDRGEGDSAEQLAGRLSLGGPVYRRIEVDSTDDAELRHFLEQEAADSAFFLLHLTCTLRPLEDEPFRQAFLEVVLENDDATAPPIAWSMEPHELSDSVEISRTVSLGPSLKIQGFGLDASAGQSVKRERQQVILSALYELESRPAWQLYSTDTVPLTGMRRFHLVVRTPKGSVTTGTARVEAMIERKRFGLRKYNAAFPGAPTPVSFALGLAS